MARILIIEDDKFQVMLRKTLEMECYKDIEEAANGKIGMELLRKNPFDPLFYFFKIIIPGPVRLKKRGRKAYLEYIHPIFNDPLGVFFQQYAIRRQKHAGTLVVVFEFGDDIPDALIQ